MRIDSVKMKRKLIFIFWFFIYEGSARNSNSVIRSQTDGEDQPSCESNEWNYGTIEKKLCWNENENHLVIRKCEARQWLPENVTCFTPETTNLFCPEDLIELPTKDKKKFVCLRISNRPQQYDKSYCYGSDTIALSEYMKKYEWSALSAFLIRGNLTKFWLPIRRADNKKYNPFMVQLPGEYWREIYEVPQTMADLSSDKHCLSAEFGEDHRWHTVLTNCNDSLHSVCMFRDSFVTASGCPQYFHAMSYRPSECYGVEWEADIFPLDLRTVPIQEYLQKRNSLQMIFKHMELIAEEYFMIGDILNETGQYAIEMNMKEHIRVVNMNVREPALSCELLTNRKNVVMVLKGEPELEGVFLTVYNRNYIWRTDDDDDAFGINCLTNADYDMWKTVKIKPIWENDLKTKSIFKLKYDGDGPGFYWCEAHTIFNFSLITTEKIVASKRPNGHSFAMHFDLLCDEIDCLNVHKNFKHFSKMIFKQLIAHKSDRKFREKYDKLIIHNVRIMDIVSVSVELKTIRFLCHVLVTLQSSSIDNSNQQSGEMEYSAEDEFGIEHGTYTILQLYTMFRAFISEVYPSLAMSIGSTEFCFPENSTWYSHGISDQWLLAKPGQSSTTRKLCLQKDGLPITRTCEGNFLEGAQWANLLHTKISCAFDPQQNIITQNLHQLTTSKISNAKNATKNIKTLLQNNIKKLIPADLYYMAKIMQRTFEETFARRRSNGLLIAEEITSDIVTIYNYLMDVNQDVAQPSIVLNSTNILLDVFENMIDTISTTEQNLTASVLSTNNSDASNGQTMDTVYFEDVGVVVKVAKNLLIFIIDPSVANVTGVGLFTADGLSDVETLQGAFENQFYRFILSNQTVDDLLYETNIQIATYVPDTLWERIDEISKLSNLTASQNGLTKKLVVKVYSSDILFQERNLTVDRSISGKIISVSIPGHDKDLPEVLPIVMRANAYSDVGNNNTIGNCSYWNYETWAIDGLVFLGRSSVDADILLCGATHLTPFAYLIAGGRVHNVAVDIEVIVKSQMHERVLDIITLLGCSLSLFGIVGVFITAITFQSWRQKVSSKLLLELCAAIALQMVLFCFVNTEENSESLIHNQIFSSCIAIGALLHYSILAQFSWMLIIGYLQFKRYVQIFGKVRPKRFLLKSSIIGWGVPFVPVLLVLIFDHESYSVGVNTENTFICYPSGYALHFAVILPISIVICANLIVYIFIIYNIMRDPIGNMRHTEKKLAISQIRLTILLFFLLGFTWIFGLMTSLKVGGIVFSYLFCLTATLQGFVLFIYFIILDPITRRLWTNHIREILGLKYSYDNSTNTKDTTQTL